MEMEFSGLYENEDRKIMKVAEDSLDPKLDRVNEIIEFAKEANINHVGIANCITFQKEAEEFESILINQGFTVSRVNCKYGHMSRNSILPDYKGTSCNPAGQAHYLEENKTELNIVMGLCLGHDIVFNSKSKALTTTLLVKDRKLKHNPLMHFKEEND
jgi:uncharacterized metal-binding protein